MRLSYNLIKSNYIYRNPSEKRVIDSNHQMEQIVQSNKAFVPVNFVSSEPSEFVEGLNPVEVELVVDEQTEQRANEIIDEALEKAEKILDEARIQANIEKNTVFDTAKTSGYQEGLIKAQTEIDLQKNELKAKEMQLENDYREKLKEIEPFMVGLLIDYLTKLTGVVAEEHEEIIVYLIRQAITGSDSSKSFTIKVSKIDFPYVNEHRSEISSNLKSDVILDILEDPGLDKNECIIETDNRVIDCGLKVQLDNLIADLKLLS